MVGGFEHPDSTRRPPHLSTPRTQPSETEQLARPAVGDLPPERCAHPLPLEEVRVEGRQFVPEGLRRTGRVARPRLEVLAHAFVPVVRGVREDEKAPEAFRLVGLGSQEFADERLVGALRVKAIKDGVSALGMLRGEPRIPRDDVCEAEAACPRQVPVGWYEDLEDPGEERRLGPQQRVGLLVGHADDQPCAMASAVRRAIA